MTPEEVAERGYAVFARHGLPPVMEYCTYCDTPEDERRLHAPLRELPDNVVWSYAMNAIHHVGDERDFLHFAPRLLADVVLERTDGDVALYLRRFREARWQEWPAGERAFVEQAMDAVWERTLATPRDGLDVEDVLCGIGTARGDLSAMLAGWAARTDRPAAANLAALVLANPDSVRTGAPLGDAWWDPGDPAMAQVVAWLREPARVDQVASAITGDGDTVDETLLAAADVLLGAS